MDTGSTNTWISSKCINDYILINEVHKPIQGIRLVGTLQATKLADVVSFKMVELKPTFLTKVPLFYVFNTPCQYNAIMGCNCLTRAHIELSFITQTITADCISIPMCTRDKFTFLYTPIEVQYYMCDCINGNIYEQYQVQILQGLSYQVVDVREVVKSFTHLNQNKQQA